MGHVDLKENFLCNWIYSFHMPLFFIVSGILENIKGKTKHTEIKNVIIKKAKSILWPYFIFSIIAIIKIYIIEGKNQAIEVALQSLFLYGYSALWFLPTLFFSQILFVIINKLEKRKKLILNSLFIIVTIILTIYLQLNNNRGQDYASVILMSFNMLNRIIIGYIFIYIGYNGYNLMLRIEKKISKQKLTIIGIAFFVVNIIMCQSNKLVDMHYSKLNNIILYYLFAIIGSFSIIYIIKYTLKESNVIEFFR